MGKKLIEHYLNQPYVWFLNKHSADLGKSILSEVNQVINGVMVPTMNLIAQSSVSFAILILLFFTDPYLAFTIGITLIGSYGIIYFLMKKFINKIGHERLQANADRFTAVSEAFNANKEAKLLGLEQIGIERFLSLQKHIQIKLQPKLLLNYLIFTLSNCFWWNDLIILLLMNRGSNFINIIPVLSPYAFAGYRRCLLCTNLQCKYEFRFSNPS